MEKIRFTVRRNGSARRVGVELFRQDARARLQLTHSIVDQRFVTVAAGQLVSSSDLHTSSTGDRTLSPTRPRRMRTGA